MIENICAVPLHPFAEGVTVIVAVSMAVVPLVPVNDNMLPLPDVVNPMLLLLFVHA